MENQEKIGVPEETAAPEIAKKESKELDANELRAFAMMLGQNFGVYERMIREKEARSTVSLDGEGKPHIFRIFRKDGEMIYMADLKYLESLMSAGNGN